MPIQVGRIAVGELLPAQRAPHRREIEMLDRHVFTETLPLERLAVVRKRAARDRAMGQVVQGRWRGGGPVLRCGVQMRLDAHLAPMDVDAAGAGEAGILRMYAFGHQGRRSGNGGYGRKTTGNTRKDEYGEKRIRGTIRTGSPSGRLGTWWRRCLLRASRSNRAHLRISRQIALRRCPPRQHGRLGCVTIVVDRLSQREPDLNQPRHAPAIAK